MFESKGIFTTSQPSIGFTWLVFRDRCLRVLSRDPEPSRLLESVRFLQKEKWKAFNYFNQKLDCLNFQDYLSVLLQNKNKWKCTKLTSSKLNEKKTNQPTSFTKNCEWNDPKEKSNIQQNESSDDPLLPDWENKTA